MNDQHQGYVLADGTIRDYNPTQPAVSVQVDAGDWTVRESEYNRLYLAALDLRRACKDRLPPGHYDKVSEECREIDVAIAQRDAARKEEA